ncbi:MAG: hypothetical protein RMH84_06920 [Sulfolobales archaeon]|nr:hypothetical protein [Sulfolobales archaeon]MCX8209135.1 hypothetical protein [Sulfolobales archaeon]MDW8011304.1 hypothetical protein [Sulfolobales archaeon]
MDLPRLSIPPRIKVLEALGALADGRVRRVRENLFEVASSDSSRKYSVYVERIGFREFRACSTDNGTVYRGYIGYPIIAVMAYSGYIRRDRDVEKALSGIPWRKLNEELRKYALVESEVLKLVSSRGVNPRSVSYAVEKTMEELRKLAVFFDSSVCGVSREEETAS